MFGILGATQVWNTDGSAVAVGGPRRRALLALLLLDAGRVITPDRLIDGLYGEEAPAGVANALQSQVSRLRQVLPQPIEFHPAGYRLAIDPDDVDAHRFQRLAAEGRNALTSGDQQRAAVLLSDALKLWRGPALADVGDAPFAPAQVTRLEELRIGAVEDRMEAELALGNHRELVAELQQHVAAHPLRERLRAQLMRALYGSGRQSEALEAYDDARRELAESLGADPGPELAAVHLAVLRGDPELTATVPRETLTSVPQPAGLRHTLPAQLTSFVGRTVELARIEQQLTGGRLVTLIGPGGAGKTRLAVEAAGRHPEEVCFVDLAGLTDAAEVPQAMLGALGLREAGLLPAAGPAVDPADRLVAALADRPLLLILDNCEHVVADVARLTARLLGACSGLRVLTTTREPLGITGETLCPIAPLRLPPPGTDASGVLEYPAVRLFADRAAAVRPDFVLENDLDAVLRVCQALDGLPLAIELAAARLRSLSASEIAARLGALSAGSDERFRLLSRGSRTAQPRQQTLRGVVDWSWELLSDAERAVLRRASVFAGGWTLAAAEAVCSDGDGDGVADGYGEGGDSEGGDGEGHGIEPFDVLDLVDSLVEKSLVVAQQPDGGHGVRYRMLETIRAYGVERLAQSGEAAELRRRHAEYFLDLVLTADPHLRRSEQLEWLQRLTADHDNLHTALRRSVADGHNATAMRLIAALSTYWLLRGVRYEGAQPACQLLAAIGPNPPAGLAEEYTMCVMAAAVADSDTGEFAAHLEAAKAAMDELGVSRRYPASILLWAPFAGVPEREVDSASQLEEYLTDPWYRALNHVGIGFQKWLVHAEVAGSEREFTAALDAFRDLGDRLGMMMALDSLAELAAFRGDPQRAVGLIDEALTMAGELDAAENMAELLIRRALCRTRMGDFDAADVDFEWAVEMSRRAGSPEMLSETYMGMGESALLRGDLAGARRLCNLALEECPAGGGFSSELILSSTLICLGRIAVAEGASEQARAYHRRALSTGLGTRHLPLAAKAADALAGLALLEGEPERAAELLGVGRALRGMEVPSAPDAAHVGAAAREALGDQAYEAAYAHGASLDVDEAFDALTALTAVR